MDCVKLFFTLPLEERLKIHVKNSMGSSFRGYEPSKIQVHQAGLKPDTKETFIFGREVPADHPDAGTFSTGPNLWPEGLPDEDFRIPVLAYQAKMLALVKNLCTILALGLPKEWGQSPNVFDPLTVEPSIPMRLLHYAPQPVRDMSQFGVGAHTDFGCVMILLQECGTDGLEVLYPPTKSWIPVPVKEGAYVINMGDTMAKWTAGYYRSARHRVIEPLGTKHRYSAPFFLNGNLKLEIKPMEGSGDATAIGKRIQQKLAETIGGVSGDMFRKKEVKA